MSIKLSLSSIRYIVNRRKTTFFAYNLAKEVIATITIKEKLQEVLDWRGKSQYDLADAVGIPRGSISSYVTGPTTISIEQAYKFAAALGVTPWTLLNGEPLLATHDDLTAEEAHTITDLRGLTLDQREVVLKTVETMKKQNHR